MTTLRAFVTLAGLIAAASGQLLGMKVCVSSDCSTGCTTWATSSGSCAVCSSSNGPCSAFNPSSITTLGGITFYSDATCTNPTTSSLPLSWDGSCHPLPTISGVSYSATNVSAVIGGIIGGIMLLVFIIIGVVFLCRSRGVPCCACCCGLPNSKTPTGCCFPAGQVQRPVTVMVASSGSTYPAAHSYPQ